MSLAMEDWPRRHLITVDEYHRMAESGSFAPDARVELIDGVIIDMPPIGSSHAGTVDQMTALLHQSVGPRAIVRCQAPVQIGEYSEPQPDIALLAPRNTFYKDRHPTEKDALLVIEVSDSTLDNDLRQKMAVYARQGVREYWVVDLVNHRLHLFRSPAGTRYEQTSSLDAPRVVEISALPGVSLDLSSIFD